MNDVKNINTILIENSLISIPNTKEDKEASKEVIGTLLSNIIYYGYTLSKESLDKLLMLSDSEIKDWWYEVEKPFKTVTGDDKNMDDFVVYKNFPKEVLDMEESEYWIKQVMMYVGYPNEIFHQEKEDRDKLNEDLNLDVLHLKNSKSLEKIFFSLIKQISSWTESQYNSVISILNSEKINFDFSEIPFKENLIKILIYSLDNDLKIKLKSATDILRLCSGLSEGDINLGENTRFKSFSRKRRRRILTLLENSSNLEDDVKRKKEKWKRLFSKLHPNEWKRKFPKVSLVYNKLYNDNLENFNSKVEKLILEKDKKVLSLLKKRPGEMMRRLNKMISLFGKDAALEFSEVLNKLTVSQLLKIEKYVETVNERKWKTIAPNGNWNKLKIFPNENKIPREIKKDLLSNIRNEIKSKIKEKTGNKFLLSEEVKKIKIQTNDSELTSYGRGTTFDIPNDIKFIRTASYWSIPSSGNIWYDNGWNFFDSKWSSLGSCCWDVERFGNNSAIFSGDPTNSKDLKGRACQMIDLYIDKLLNKGVRYAVWSILCYSRKPFNYAEEVYASLQWGEKEQEGKLFEPSRSQLSFPIKGDNFTKFIAYLDLKERKLVYMDANLKANVSSARNNSYSLQNKMPPFIEYLKTLPSIYDLFKNNKTKKGGIRILNSDKDIDIKKEKAWVFKPSNEKNIFEQLDISELLN